MPLSFFDEPNAFGPAAIDLVEDLTVETGAEHILRGRFAPETFKLPKFAAILGAKVSLLLEELEGTRPRPVMRPPVPRLQSRRSHDDKTAQDLELSFLGSAAMIDSLLRLGADPAWDLIKKRFNKKNAAFLAQMVRGFVGRQGGLGVNEHVWLLLFFHHFAWWFGNMEAGQVTLKFFHPQDQALCAIQYPQMRRRYSEETLAALVFDDQANAPSRRTQLESMVDRLTSTSLSLFALRTHWKQMHDRN